MKSSRSHSSQVLCLGIASLLSVSCAVAAAAQDPPIKTLSALKATDEQEKSEYLTGGDVRVVTREEIEANHYTTVEEAIKRIPGVQISSPGYKASEYGTTFGTEVSLNGDSGVIILVDGRRLDNDASSYGGARSKSRVPLDVVTNIGAVERIEVIKGAGSAFFGGQATGGVINIITRSGGEKQATVLNAAAGSWDKQSYSLTQSGPITDSSFRYFGSLSYNSRNDSKYKDDYTDKTVTYDNTGYREKAASLRIDKDFTDSQSLSLFYSGNTNKAHYPITAPDYATLDLLYANNLPSTSTRPGYRNWFLYDAWLGSYTGETSNDVDLKYTFTRDAGYESYIRGYKNYRRYVTRDFAGLFGTQLGNITPSLIATALSAPGTQRREEVDGAQLQLARQMGIHGLMGGADYSKSQLETLNLRAATRTYVKRDSLKMYFQDKLQLTDRLTVTPGVNYGNYSTIKRISATSVTTEKGSSSKVAFSIFNNYRFDSIGNLHLAWSQIFRPVSNYDYDSETIEKLLDEKGNNWAVGVEKDFSTRTTLSINYSLSNLENAIARYSVWDPTVVNTGSPTGFGNFVTRSVNATQKKESFNVAVRQQFNDHLSGSVSYAYVNETFSAKNYAINEADTTNINALINKFRSPNTYQADLQYNIGKWSTNVTAQFNSGNNTAYFTERHFQVFGAGVNYDLFERTQLYAKIDNLTNAAYENKASASYGPGAFPQPARSWTFGIQQKL